MSSQPHGCFPPQCPEVKSPALGGAVLGRFLLWPRRKLTNPVATVGEAENHKFPGIVGSSHTSGLCLCPLWLPCPCSSWHPCDRLCPSLFCRPW